MSAEEHTPPKYLPDILLWEEELPAELRTGIPEEADLIDTLIRTELTKNDRNFEQFCAQLQRLNMLPTASIYHSYGTTDGFVCVASNRVPASDKYTWENCVNVTINYRSNDLFARDPKRHISIEDYFVDYGRNLLTVRTGVVTIGRNFALPPGLPPVIWKDVSGKNWLYRGDGYELTPPDYDTPLEYDDARQLRLASGKLASLLAGLSDATYDP